MYKVPRTKYEIRGTKYDIFLMSNAERRVQNAEVGQRATAKKTFRAKTQEIRLSIVVSWDFCLLNSNKN